MAVKKKHIALIALGVIVALILAAAGTAFAYYKSKLNLIPRSDGVLATEGSVNASDPEVLNFNSEMEEIIKTLPDWNEVGDGEDTDLPGNDVPGSTGGNGGGNSGGGSGGKPGGSGGSGSSSSAALGQYSDPDVFNILLIGTDERTTGYNDFARGDTCMLMSLNKKTGSIALVSFERGMGVPILEGRYKGYYDWLTHAFEYGGASLMMRELRECFKVDVTRYVRVNFTAFRKGINAIGGVTVTMDKAEAKWMNAHYGGYQKFQVGSNTLKGDTALGFARLRAIDSDWQRIERQRAIIQAALNKVKDLSFSELNDLMNEVLPLVLTNLTDGEITQLLWNASKFQGATASQLTIPVKGTYSGMIGLGKRSMFRVNFTKNTRILRDFLYPGWDDVKEEPTDTAAETTLTAETETTATNGTTSALPVTDLPPASGSKTGTDSDRETTNRE